MAMKNTAPPPTCPHTEAVVQECVDEECEAEVDTGCHRHLPEQVEPAGEPGPRRGVAPCELGGPVVETSRRRVARRHLGHAEGYEGHEPSDDEPADRHLGRPA